VITRDRREALLRTLHRLVELHERPPIIVVDNGSSDGSVEAVRAQLPGIEVVALPDNRGAVARNVGMARAQTPFVAFCDDDSWWAPGALRAAAAHLAAAPRLAVLQARILVGPEERLDPACAAMAGSPLRRPEDAPGPVLLGFVACGAVVRRDALLAVGGFDDLLFFLGEEQLVAVDLASAGWYVAYVDDVVAHHHPALVHRDPRARARLQRRNALLTTWLRRPWPVVVRATLATAAGAPGALLDAARRLPAVRRRRRPLPAEVEAGLRLLAAEGADDGMRASRPRWR
jgi:GT2 family glycosyltransferase